ncbi:Alanyl-tRNA synthetase [Dissulfuribacter thermophilus]|uniref:Alanine--tRNA ligase n=1 Tax=Dissulfuribacter thermophilus TaxID=1156395 RepID=A0A1B9F7M2_9BACT|nr:alanine--tRNA ligase [Dissulfuribacter thermophilus]OCC15939.1 Alanyl-tRNA synthetase [Dissulfuribacter thermophilus]
MKITASKDIRQAFLSYFEQKGHKVVPSSSLVPADDPSLLFTNAGMVQFKQVFLGEEKRDYKRAATCQKCVRAGGKHNDLENVGYTARHHTFFEMLGNFSFGDYFKEGAIRYAWDFLTNIIGLPKEKLWITVFEDDDEARELWHKVAGVPKDRIVGLGEKDNFWAMGDTGPCGPCSEILIDQGEEVGCGSPDCRVGCDCDRFLELWNLVFMQFFRDESGELHPLPRPSIDTGMGLERIAAVCQGKLNNFDSDLFEGIIRAIEDLSNQKYGRSPEIDVAMRVIADHGRASAFLIADGVIPSNEGRGFVLRRIIRRAARYGRTLGLSEPFMARVCDRVVEEMKDAYPELVSAKSSMRQILDTEEERFLKTLDFGLEILMEELDTLRKKGEGIIPGSFAFKLYDTYGFPIDIVQDVAKEQGFEIDREGFERELEAQRKRSKGASKEVVTKELPPKYQELVEQGRGGEFIGYETLEAKATLLALYGGNSKEEETWCSTDEAKGPKWYGEAIFSRTPFYAESGGQVGDKGEIRAPGTKALCHDTVKKGALICHRIELKEGSLKVGEEYDLSVFEGDRADTARNHTATHLLHAALREVLGDHVKQAGSLVDSSRLRFDFTHFSKIEPVLLQRIEAIVNEAIRRDLSVRIEETSFEEAKSRGAMALFGEKYGDRVRVVEVPGVSIELCGGTHVKRTGSIGLFKIVSESSVAAGIRRIEAVTGKYAIDHIQSLEQLVFKLAAKLKCPPDELESRVDQLTSRLKALMREIEELKVKGSALDVDDLVSKVSEVSGVKVLAHEIKNGDPKVLRELGDRLRAKLGSGVVVLGSKNQGKALLLVMVTKDLVDKLHAGNIIKELSAVVGGRGGGRPDMAQAGGPNPERLEEALKLAPKTVKEVLSVEQF